MSEFWELLSLLFKTYGLTALFGAALLAVIAYLLFVLRESRKENKDLQEKLLQLAEKRLEDAKEEREDYEELAKNLDKSINLLISVFNNRRSGDG